MKLQLKAHLVEAKKLEIDVLLAARLSAVGHFDASFIYGLEIALFLGSFWYQLNSVVRSNPKLELFNIYLGWINAGLFLWNKQKCEMKQKM